MKLFHRQTDSRCLDQSLLFWTHSEVGGTWTHLLFLSSRPGWTTSRYHLQRCCSVEKNIFRCCAVWGRCRCCEPLTWMYLRSPFRTDTQSSMKKSCCLKVCSITRLGVCTVCNLNLEVWAAARAATLLIPPDPAETVDPPHLLCRPMACLWREQEDERRETQRGREGLLMPRERQAAHKSQLISVQLPLSARHKCTGRIIKYLYWNKSTTALTKDLAWNEYHPPSIEFQTKSSPDEKKDNVIHFMDHQSLNSLCSYGWYCLPSVSSLAVRHWHILCRMTCSAQKEHSLACFYIQYKKILVPFYTCTQKIAFPYPFRSCDFLLLSASFACTEMGKKDFIAKYVEEWKQINRQYFWQLLNWWDLCWIILHVYVFFVCLFF